jgi:RNA polymerase II subunit A-like phosphatase
MIAQTSGNGVRISLKSFHVSHSVTLSRTFCSICPSDDFFVGIGDINSTFLPKVEPLLTTPTLPPSLQPSPEESSTRPTSLETQSSPEETQKAELVKDAMLTQNELALEAQLEERPLAKKQEELLVTPTGDQNGQQQEVGGEEEDKKPPDPSPPSLLETQSGAVDSKPAKVPRKALLKNDDVELQRVTKVYSSRRMPGVPR